MRFKSFLFVGMLLAVLFSFSMAFALDGLPERPDRHVPGEIIIGFHPTANYFQIVAAVSSIGGKVIGNAPRIRARRIKLSSTDPSSIDEAIQSLKSNPASAKLVKYVEPNRTRKAHSNRTSDGEAGILSQSGDPLLYGQWGYYDVSANWLNAPTSTYGVTVAVIDTGVDYNHPDLLKKVKKGYDFVNLDKDPMDDYGHGTHVAGIIAAKANNGYGIAGVSWNAKILAIKVLASSGYGTSWDVAKGIEAAANNSAVKVINLSLGGEYSELEEDAISYAVIDKGKLVVASAGNDNTNDPTYNYPAALSTTFPDRVLAVAAHGEDHCRGLWLPSLGSNYGNWVSISAPGTDIYSTFPFSLGSNGFAVWSGTSMAAPFVSGAAALAWERNPTYTNQQIGNLITTMNSSLWDPLDRSDPDCWPNGPEDGTFERLDVLHLLEQQYYEVCDNKGAIYGYAFDAETGIPLVGGKVSAKQGTTAVGIDYVPYIGELTTYGDDLLYGEFYGLFNILAPIGDLTLTIQKTSYATTIPKDQTGVPELITVDPCVWSYAGNIPVPPAKSYYWLVVTWEPGFTDTYFGSALDVYDYGEYWDTYYSGNPGILSIYPYVNHIWDSYLGMGDLRDYSETIRILKTSKGTSYLFYVVDWFGGSLDPWGASGIKAYLFKGNKLVKTYTPPPGSDGNTWLICDIYGTTITDYNYVDTF